jgi:2,3-dihydroxyphenylpropionate 1,2-dioxygenase
MDIGLSIACSHAGLIVTRRENASIAAGEEFFAAMARLRDEVKALRPDAIVILATDHMKAWTLAGGIPQFAIGVGPVAHGLGDAGIPEVDLPVNQEIARALLRGCIDQGADLAYTEDVRIDHSFVVPLSLLDPDGTVPIVPLTQNCNVPPRPTWRRSHEFGRQLRAVLDTLPGRVVVVATGGLSHWVGDAARRAFMNRPPGARLAELSRHPVTLEETGPVNEDFDHGFLDAVCAGGAARFMAGWPDHRLEAEAGNGAHEVRNWITACGLMADAPASVVAYAPVEEWLTGVGVVRFGAARTGQGQ